jgi:quercetin dioxygenase-like cupin family protein
MEICSNKNSKIPTMKKTIFINVAWIAAFMFVIPAVKAQDMKKAESKIINVLIDTTLIRTAEITLAPGQKTDAHTHPAHFLYALTECKLKVFFTDGQIVDYDLKPGDSGYGDPERPHQTQNMGNKPAKFLLVELKEHPYKPANMSKQ